MTSIKKNLHGIKILHKYNKENCLVNFADAGLKSCVVNAF